MSSHANKTARLFDVHTSAVVQINSTFLKFFFMIRIFFWNLVTTLRAKVRVDKCFNDSQPSFI